MSTFKPYIPHFRQISVRIYLFLIPIIGIFVLINLNFLLNLSSTKKVKSSTQEKLQGNCRDWHDYKQIYEDLLRKGFGEHGTGFKVTDENEIALNKKFFSDTGYGAVVSDRISVNRSIQDTRHPDCQNYLYPSELPNVSIIIIFYNEVLSVLQRTLHSIVNRTPPELLHEIILVNDLSSNEELYENLQEYVIENFPNTTIIIKNLQKRSGLIVTRLEGAEIATGEILVFFDSHTEVNINWLPPLLAPLKANRRLATNPTIDYFDPETFQLDGAYYYSERGGFDWDLTYHQFSRIVPDGYNKLKPYPNPVMLGCAFAIDRKFFMETLDGYDRDYRIWNAENYELSLKLWLCADGLYEVPCSRITHTFRGHNPSRSNIPYDYLGRNFKRLVEVWFDEYKEVVYDQNRERYDKIDPGDLTHVKAVRERLKCKNFSYFLHHVIPEMIIRYPIDKNVPVFASGQIRLLNNDSICIDYEQGANNETARLKECKSKDEIFESQQFRLTFYKNIIFEFTELCLDAWNMNFQECHFAKLGNQFWKYNETTRMINSGSDNNDNCITANIDAGTVYLKSCDIEDMNQKWRFNYENYTALNDWSNIYGYETFIYGVGKADWSSMLPLQFDEECPL